jgi:ADP-heptose:LPS heptosyltransferase
LVLVLRPGALGDTLLALPALRALKARFGPLALAAHGGAARLLATLGEVDTGTAFDDPALAWLFGESATEEPIVAWLNAAGLPALRHALVVAPGRPTAEQHCAEYLLETLAPVGVDLTLDAHPLDITPFVTDEILVHPGSGSAAKNWPAANLANVIRQLRRPVRLIVGEADASAADAVQAELGCALPRLENLPLEELAARLAGCHAYLGNDSGVSHLAGLSGARAVVLFGPTSPVIWRPLGPRVAVYRFDAEPGQVANDLAD